MPASTDFLQWNPTAANQETDASYSTDAMRVAGASTAAIFPSTLANKLFFQCTTFISAFCQMLAAKGYSTSDASISALVSVLMNVKTASEFLTAIQTVAYASSVTFDATQSASFFLTLTGNVTAATLSGVTNGQWILFIVAQDGTGNHTFTWPANLSNPGNICPQASTYSIQLFVKLPGVTNLQPITPMIWSTPTGILSGSGPVLFSINTTGTISGAYLELTEKVDASGGAVTRTLPTGVSVGVKVNVKKMDASQNGVTIAGPLEQGQTSYTLTTQSMSVTFQYDGSIWILI